MVAEHNHPEEAGLVAKMADCFAANDQEGAARYFTQLTKGYRKYSYVMARAKLGRHEDAEDVVQEVLMRLWRAAPRMTPERKLRPYVNVITLNEVRRFAEKRAKDDLTTGEIYFLTNDRDDVPPEDDYTVVDYVCDMLRDHEGGELASLYLQSDMTLKECAEALKISHSLAIKRWNEMREAVVKALGGYNA